MRVTPTRLQFPLVHIKARFVAVWVGLCHGTSTFAWEKELMHMTEQTEAHPTLVGTHKSHLRSA